jgi:putative FmdB family regulatory protein
MPVYEYECTGCGHRFDLRRRVDDKDDEVRCPECNTGHPRRIFSLFTKGPSNGGGGTGACAPSSPT